MQIHSENERDSHTCIVNLYNCLLIHVGQFKVPVSCLIEPSPFHLIRKPDPQFVSLLKKEMISNPTQDVAPIVGLVKLSHTEQFCPAHAEAYQYETIGGNHSRIALQEILQDCDTSSRFLYSHRLVSVYHGLSDEQVQHLAHCHNRATEFTSKMTNQDKVLFIFICFIVFLSYFLDSYV